MAVCCLQVRIELYDRKQTKFISAHNTPLVCLTLSMDGKRLATASDKGTLVRVWNTADGQLLQVRGQWAGSPPWQARCHWLRVLGKVGVLVVVAAVQCQNS